jgi:hypothetical protein
MSAFICSEDHIGALVRFWIENDRYGRFREQELNEADWRQIFASLATENGRSMIARYGNGLDEIERTGPTPTKGLRSYPTLEPIAAIKQAQCYEYQACEHDGWSTSEACRITQRIISAAIDQIPGYHAAPWGI